ncbi:MAG: class I SAM-dependent methyltransferase [Planctomycetota bacterium]|nr:class I SAM-dependent methyltransferase [Planctomycetota bacterium]
MKHHEISQAIRDVMKSHGGPISLWDLGCGCGTMARMIFNGIEVDRYVGVDLSDSGLGRAAVKLKGVASSIQIERREIKRFLVTSELAHPSFILASFSLHHFQPDELREVLEGIEKYLEAGAKLVWVDPVRQAHESRDEFIRRFLMDVFGHWSSLSPEQLQEVESHIQQSDYPLDDIERDRLLDETGLVAETTCYRDDFYTAQLIVRQT